MALRFLLLVLCLFLLSAAIVYFAAPPAQFQQNISDRQQSSECSADADCVPAGCSQQVCTTTVQAKDLITTCEYKSEYVCLAYTSCGCQQGSCQWAKTEQYAACLGEKSGVMILE